MPSFEHADAPIFECQLDPPDRDGFRAWSFYCPYCKRRHRHSPEPGHRVAHCHDDQSPYADTGYSLRLRPHRTTT